MSTLGLRHSSIWESVRKGIDELEIGGQDTADILTEISREIDKSSGSSRHTYKRRVGRTVVLRVLVRRLFDYSNRRLGRTNSPPY